VSKHNDDKQHIWESGADGNFAVSEDRDGEALGRGTLLKIHFKVIALVPLLQSEHAYLLCFRSLVCLAHTYVACVSRVAVHI
jgi:hypothetical protein